MPKTVPLEGLGHVAFPEGTPDHEIQWHIDEHLGKPRRDLIRGMADIPLSRNGIAHIRQLGQQLGPFDVIFMNDLRRNQQTARLLNPKRTIIDTYLRPMNYGAFTGKPSDQFAPAMHAMIKANPRQPLPQGDSFAQWVRRLAEAAANIDDFIAIHPNQKVGVVMNRSSIQVYQTALKGGNLDDALKYAKDEKPGSAFKRNGDELVLVTADQGPGQYVIRHGETFWNGTNEEQNAAS